MPTKHADLWRQLTAPFEPHQLKVKFRKTREGTRIPMPYVDAQHIQERLDQVLGPENWELDLTPWGSDLISTLRIRLPDGVTVQKSDVGGRSKMQDSADEPKAAASHALRRCGVLFGIGRYLYLKEGPKGGGDRAEPRPQAPRAQAPPAEPDRREKERHYWGTAGHGEEARRDDRPAADDPRTGRALFARLKDLDEDQPYELLKHVSAWGKRQEMPPRMVDWDAEQVKRGWAEACRRAKALRESAEYQEALS